MKQKNLFSRIKDRLSLEYEILKMNFGINNSTPTTIMTSAATLGITGLTIGATAGDKPQTEQVMNDNTLDGKTVKGYVVDENNNPWNDQIAKIMLGDSTVAIDTIKNGNFELTDIITGIEDEQRTNIQSLIKFYGSNNKLYVKGLKGESTATISDAIGQTKTIEVKNLLDLKGLSSGFYNITIENEQEIYSRGIILVEGRIFPTVKFNYTSKIQKNKSLNKTLADYKLVISGPDVMTKEQVVDLTPASPIDLGTITAPSKPIIISTANGVYDIDTKYDANNNRQTPSKIANLKVSLGSDPNVYTFTNSDGQFSLKVDKLGTDSLFITGATSADTAYYNWHLPEINIQQGNNEITAFNDTTGIPMISRMWDSEVGVDFLDHLFYVTNIEGKFPTYPEWSKAMPRVRDEDLPIKVFMNRAIDPTGGWYADSSMAGLKATETGRYRFVETADSNQALLQMRYDYDKLGQGTNVGVDFDASGPYISHWDIRISGPPNGGLISAIYVPMLVAHEDLHIAFAVGQHSLKIQDIFYGSPIGRVDHGFPLKMSAREEKAVKTIYALERNPKLLHYTK